MIIDRTMSNVIRLAAATAALAIITASAGLAPAQATQRTKTCASLSDAIVSGWFGKAMEPSKLPGIVDCQWVPADNSPGTLTIQVVPARYYDEPNLGPQFKRLTGIGDRAFVVHDMGGWTAGALKGRKALVIHVDGGKTNRATAITILKTLLPTV